MINWLLRIILFTISIYSITFTSHEIDLYVMIHIIIIGISSYSLFSYKSPFSLYKIYHIFNLLFFGIAPVLQYYNNIRFMGEPRISYSIKLQTSLIILFTTLIYNLFYSYSYRKISYKKNKLKIKRFLYRMSIIKIHGDKIPLTVNFLFIFFSTLSLLMILYLNNFNIMSLFFRGGEFSQQVEVEKSTYLLIDKFFRPLSLIVFIISMKYTNNKWFINLILFVLFLLTCFPTGMPRYNTAAFYIPLLLLFIPFFKNKNVFVNVMLAGFLLVFPFLDGFRRYGKESQISFGLNYDMFLEMHFDAYLSFVRAVNLDIITNGKQLLGVVFFFVPRSIWIEKPIGSGSLEAEKLDLYFNNISCTYIAEGYINFGIIGSLLFILFIARVNAYLDKFYWVFKSKDSFFNILYILFLGMYIFILRGDLMNGFAYTFGIIFTALFTYNFFKKLM